MRLDDPKARWVQVEFEVSPSDAPGQLDSTYTEKALAWFEPSIESGYAQVTVPGRVVEEHLLVKQNPKRGSFSDYVWIFDVETGHVKSATLSGTLIRTLQLGFLKPKLEADVRAEMATSAEAGFQPPRRMFGQTLFTYCGSAKKKGCTTITPVALSADRGYVNAVGVLTAKAGMFTTHAFSPIGDAVFTEIESAGELLAQSLETPFLVESVALDDAEEKL
jgi:hypothetical protein